MFDVAFAVNESTVVPLRCMVNVALPTVGPVTTTLPAFVCPLAGTLTLTPFAPTIFSWVTIVASAAPTANIAINETAKILSNFLIFISHLFFFLRIC